MTESSTGELKLYLDGTEVGHSAEAAVDPASLGSAATAYLGKSLASAPSFEGRLSNVAFYTKALSASAIEAHYYAGEFPVNTTAPAISGTAEEGSTLSAEAGSWTGLAPITFGYQWRRCNSSGESCSDISGATGSSYNAGFEDIDHKLRVRITATNAAGSGEVLSSTSAFVAPAPLTEFGYASEFGTEGSGDGQFKEPFGVVVGPESDIFVLDRGNDRVEKFNEAGEYIAQFGSEGSGDGQLSSPEALAVDSKGDVFVLDTGNERVEEFNEHGEFLRTFGAGLIGSAEGIAVDRHGRVWVSATYEGHLVVFNEEGEFLKDVGSYGSEPGEFDEPEGLAVDAEGHVWVADYIGRVDEFDEETGEYLSQFGSKGGGAGQLSGAYGIAVNAGHVFVGELTYDRVQEFDEEGGFIAQLGVSGTEAGDLRFPSGLAIDQAHDLLITDLGNERVEKWSPEAPGAPANLAPPSISGVPGVGSTLAAAAGVWRGSPRRSYAYQWESCNEHGEECEDIVGATSSTYSAVGTDLGNTLRVVVTATNSHGSASSTSAATEPIGEPPVNISPPTISGTAQEGQKLSADVGTWEGAGYYQVEWQRCNERGEECANLEVWEESYTATAADVGHTLRVIVNAVNSAGETTATSASTSVVIPATPPANLSAPDIVGVARDGETVTAQPGSWSGSPTPTYQYQWQLCEGDGSGCDEIDSANSANYTIGSADLRGTLRVTVTASNIAGSVHATSAASSEIEPGAPSEIEPPSITGNPYEGETLYGESGQWGGTEDEVVYQWERCNSTAGECADIAGAVEADYDPTGSDVGKTLRVRVGVNNQLGAVTAISPATEAISAASKLTNTSAASITGTPQSEQTLSADAGSWLGVTTIGYTYQWQRCDVYGASCEDIDGATSSSYTPSSEDVGSTIRVRVHASEEEGGVYETSAATQPIAANTAPVVEGPPTVSGTGLVGDEVIATTGSWSGEPVSYSYQWERCNESGESCSSISGATSSAYTLIESDATHTVRVLVTATGAGSSSTEAASFPLSVSGTILANVAAPSISGSYEMDRALSANRGIWTGAGALSYSYQWKRCNEHGESCGTISEAAESSYTPSSADVGHTLEVVVTATGTAGTESATSTTTPVIVSSAIAPENLFAPTIEGNLTSGETLTAQAGTWLSTEALSYAYQWQICSATGEECLDAEGATASTYPLTEADVGSTLRVIVTASNTLGTASATSEASEAVGAAGPPANVRRPVVYGTAKQGERLFVGNGSWSGSRPLRYYYRWELCNDTGEDCEGIEGATAASYTMPGGHGGSSIRVKVTATNTLGSAGAVSAQAIVSESGEANTTPAIELAEKTDPSVLAPAAAETIEEQEVKPALSDTGEQLSATATLTKLLDLEGHSRRIRGQHSGWRTELRAPGKLTKCDQDADDRKRCRGGVRPDLARDRHDRATGRARRDHAFAATLSRSPDILLLGSRPRSQRASRTAHGRERRGHGSTLQFAARRRAWRR